MHIEDITILITDDSILARKQLKDIISSLGTPNFIEAKDGQDAIDKNSSLILHFLTLLCQRKMEMTPSGKSCNLIRMPQLLSLLQLELNPS